MTDIATLDYYRHRQEQERTLADRATQPGARRIHCELADRYAQLIGKESAAKTKLGIVVCS